MTLPSPATWPGGRTGVTNVARKPQGRPLNGWLAIDKPLGMTSTAAVAIVKRTLQARKVGHAGTLDPAATGILPMALGEATKLISYAMAGSKAYRFTLSWGETTDTDDAEGQVVAHSDVRPSQADIEAALPEFVGEIDQRPPAFSAIKVEGKRAYDLARSGESPNLASRRVSVAEYRLLEADVNHAKFEVICGKGVYIRALGRDLAARLGACGHVCELRRTRVGPFAESDGFSLDKLGELVHSSPLENWLLPIEAPLDDILAVAVMEGEAERLRLGQAIRVPRQGEGEVLIKASGRAIGLGHLKAGELRPKRVFNL